MQLAATLKAVPVLFSWCCSAVIGGLALGVVAFLTYTFYAYIAVRFIERAMTTGYNIVPSGGYLAWTYLSTALTVGLLVLLYRHLTTPRKGA